MTWDEEHETLLEQELREKQHQGIEAFNLRYATGSQEQAIRDYAETVGYTDLRRFKGWMNEADLDYYDILKIQSPDD